MISNDNIQCIVLSILSRWMQDGFAIATRIPSFENSFWIYMPDSIITVDVNHRQPEQAILFKSLLLYTKSWATEEPRKTSHMSHEPTGNVRSPLSLSPPPRKPGEATASSASVVVMALMTAAWPSRLLLVWHLNVGAWQDTTNVH